MNTLPLRGYLDAASRSSHKPPKTCISGIFLAITEASKKQSKSLKTGGFMRIQETNEILNESRHERLEHARHEGDLSNRWDTLKTRMSDVFSNKTVQASLAAAGTAMAAGVAAMMLRSRGARSNGWSFGR
jgi:hypothetical protein